MLWIRSWWFNGFLAQQRDGDMETKEDILKKMFELFLSVLWTMKICEVQNNTETHWFLLYETDQKKKKI